MCLNISQNIASFLRLQVFRNRWAFYIFEINLLKSIQRIMKDNDILPYSSLHIFFFSFLTHQFNMYAVHIDDSPRVLRPIIFPQYHDGVNEVADINTKPRMILCMRPANERWCYIVMPSLIGWAHTQNHSCETLWIWYHTALFTI